MTDRGLLERRLERFRATRASGDIAHPRPPRLADRRGLLAERLATRLGGRLEHTGDVTIVRIDGGAQRLPVDRARLATLPGQPPPDVPLLCLDTETTGLGTAAGTLVFLVGLGWWEADRFHQAQLLLPDQADEPGLLAALSACIPIGAWLVTYNGRTFDWPLLETRYRLRRGAPPDLAGHLDLLPMARRLFRHRLPDARLRTVERHVLGMTRYGDVDGALIPGRYLDALSRGDPEGLVDVVRHNDLDVLALARLVAHVETTLGDVASSAARVAAVRPPSPSTAHPGDLAGLGRAFRREGRHEEALACLDLALAGQREPDGRQDRPPPTSVDDAEEDRLPWWSARARPDIGGPKPARPPLEPATVDLAWTEERLLVERARILRRLGRTDEAADTWRALTAGPGRLAAVAAIELAKLQEHHLRDRRAALATLATAWRIVERRRRLGLPDPALEADLVRRGARLRRRMAREPGAVATLSA